MRLPGCTSPVAGKSSSRIIRRGAKFMKDTPRSGSSVNTAPTRKRARPSSTAPPGRTLSAAIIRSSSQTEPRGGIASISASAVLRAGATRSLPRSGYPGVTALTAVSSASLPALAMLTKVTLSARARPSRMISSRNSGLQAWSAVISTSAPSTWCASRVSACRTRSAKKATLETPPTASTRASAKKHPEGETQHRRSSFAADAPRDEPDLPRATAGDRFVMGDKQKRRARFRVHLEHQVDHPSPGRGIEIAGRLVGEQELGLRDEGASERDALLLPSGKGLRVMPQALSEPHARKHSRRQIRRARITRELQRQHHVLERVQRREQLERLEYEAEQPRAERRAPVLVQAEEIRAVEPHPARARRIQAGEKPEERRFSGTRGADDGDGLARHDLERNVLQNDQLVRARGAVGKADDLRKPGGLDDGLGKIRHEIDTVRRPARLLRNRGRRAYHPGVRGQSLLGLRRSPGRGLGGAARRAAETAKVKLYRGEREHQRRDLGGRRGANRP